MKIVVTGGMGFIGSNFIRRLLDKKAGINVVNFDLLTYAGNKSNLKDIESDERYTFVKGDISNPDQVKDLFIIHRPDVVINFAAESHVDRSLFDAKAFLSTNVIGVDNLLKATRQYGLGKFIQVSTDEVYGDIPEGFSKEDSHLNPSNPYAASKAAADMMVKAYIRSYDLPVMTVRGSNNFGPYQYPEKLIPLSITNLLLGESVPVHGSGQQIRTWIHVFDFCDGIIELLNKGQLHEIYNIAGIEKTNIEVIKNIADILGHDFEINVVNSNDRPGADMRYAPDGEKILKDIGFKPQYIIDDTLKSVVDWYVENEKWWKDIRHKDEFKNHYQNQKIAKYS